MFPWVVAHLWFNHGNFICSPSLGVRMPQPRSGKFPVGILISKLCKIVDIVYKVYQAHSRSRSKNRFPNMIFAANDYLKCTLTDSIRSWSFDLF